MLNRATIVGRITKDLEIRISSSGKKFIGFTVAVNGINRGNSTQNNVDFISCYAWERTAENMVRYLSKGSLIAIDGSIGTKKSNGVYSTFVNAQRVSFLDSKNDRASVPRNYNKTATDSNLNTNFDFNNTVLFDETITNPESMKINSNKPPISTPSSNENLNSPSSDNKEPIKFDNDDILWE